MLVRSQGAEFFGGFLTKMRKINAFLDKKYQKEKKVAFSCPILHFSPQIIKNHRA